MNLSHSAVALLIASTVGAVISIGFLIGNPSQRAGWVLTVALVIIAAIAAGAIN